MPVGKPMVHALLDRILGAAEEINGHGRCPTYMYRWIVATIGPVKIYVHHFVGDDWSLDEHDHPKRFITIGLKGRYLEWSSEEPRWYRAPWVRTFAANHRHRICMLRTMRADNGFVVHEKADCWTLVLVGPPQRKWGFWHFGRFVPFREYVLGPLGDKMKACG